MLRSRVEYLAERGDRWDRLDPPAESPMADELAGLEGQLDPQAATDGGDEP
jgi:hypothetical protein